ncbi:uncharacterized protein LOC144654375 isoform X2 [Oculina patagonica]
MTEHLADGSPNKRRKLRATDTQTCITANDTVTNGDIGVTLMKNERLQLQPFERLFRLYDGVETFVMFTGYRRSCHSLLAAMLDAHPEIIITSGCQVTEKWEQYQTPELKQKNMQKYRLFYDLHHHSLEHAMFSKRAGSDSCLLKKSKYNYHIPGLWQGGYQNRIKVIGDRKVEETALALASKMGVLEEIRQVVQLPIKLIHVIRNPFDNIATMMLRATESRDAVRENGLKIENKEELDRAIERYFKAADANRRVKLQYKDAVIDIPAHEMLLRPKETLQRLCEHLGVTCPKDYVEKCIKILRAPSVTRDKVVWTKEQKEWVTNKMKDYPFLEEYSFDEHPK